MSSPNTMQNCQLSIQVTLLSTTFIIEHDLLHHCMPTMRSSSQLETACYKSASLGPTLVKAFEALGGYPTQITSHSGSAYLLIHK